ncbi:MAG TPA: chemotaxis protein CheC, partial [Candidatus Dorea gallistercoris]|nr:chemotaxis protein CheC [Candidatus Dorea gallistercoris]
MSEKKLSTMEIDAIGEILNISLGASATAVSTMLEARVDITTPVVRVATREEFTFSNLKPAIGVEISYIEGLSGKNVMLLKRSDVKVIVEMLMGMSFTDEEFELNEMNISAISEVMNQMMGASSTALSELFGRPVNISTPQAFEVDG